VDPASPLLSIISIFLIQSEKLYVFLYHFSSSFLLSSSTAAIAATESFDLYRHNSFQAAFVQSSHHMTVPSQSGISYFVSNVGHSQSLSDDLTPFIILQLDSKYCISHFYSLSSSHFSLFVAVQTSAPYIRIRIFV